MTVWSEAFAVVGFNGVGAMPVDRSGLGNRILETAADKLLRNGGGLLLGCEMDDAVVSEVLDPEIFWWRHRNAPNLDGVLIAGTRDRSASTTPQWREGAPQSRVNDPRPILTAEVSVDDCDDIRVGVMHLPKPVGGAAAGDEMFRHSHEYHMDLFMADFNRRQAAIKKRYPQLRVQSREVMGAVSRPGVIHAGPLKSFDLLPGTSNDDHPGIILPARVRVR